MHSLESWSSDMYFKDCVLITSVVFIRNASSSSMACQCPRPSSSWKIPFFFFLSQNGVLPFQQCLRQSKLSVTFYTKDHFVSIPTSSSNLSLLVKECGFIFWEQVTLDLQNTNEKFGCFLRSALDVLSQILELATLQDIGKV